jgi:hypothetical protein
MRGACARCLHRGRSGAGAQASAAHHAGEQPPSAAVTLRCRAAAAAAKNIGGRWQRLVKKALDMQRAREDVLGLR